MTKDQFMKELARLLQDISPEEREEALAYYEGYFADAGPEAEAEVLRELGSPEKVAATIKGVDGAYRGSGQTTARPTGAASCEAAEKSGPSGWKIAFWVLLAVVTFPLWFGAVMAAFGILIAVICVAVGLVAGVAALTVALVTAGFGLLTGGVGTLLLSPILGVLLAGAGLLVLGLAALALCLTVLIIGKLLPACIRGIRNLWGRLFQTRRAAV